MERQKDGEETFWAFASFPDLRDPNFGRLDLSYVVVMNT